MGERLRATQGAQEALINTAYIERLQATFRSRLAPLVRKTPATARQRATLEGACGWSGRSTTSAERIAL